MSYRIYTQKNNIFADFDPEMSAIQCRSSALHAGAVPARREGADHLRVRDAARRVEHGRGRGCPGRALLPQHQGRLPHQGRPPLQDVEDAMVRPPPQPAQLLQGKGQQGCDSGLGPGGVRVVCRGGREVQGERQCLQARLQVENVLPLRDQHPGHARLDQTYQLVFA